MTSDQPGRRLQQISRRCLERFHELERLVFRYHVGAFEDRRHLQPETSERSYYSAGYLQALKDVRELISTGEFPNNLSFDGGPRVPIHQTPEGPHGS